ncbi:MAG TPA: RHS repeat-associated core domain-containing protein [Bacteroidia bacterium]|nr:RHS repeat-associated core domain-containing protein [Bacteroidia bacterium]
MEEVHNQFYTSLLEYNAENRLQKLTYPGGFAVEYEYDTKGYTTKIKRADNGAAIWSLGEISASGQFTKFTLGTNTPSENLYSNFGFLKENKTTGIQNMHYTFDMRNGNMLQREDVLHNLTEDFTYDNLDRLKTISLNNTLVSELTYTANGNIESKTELGLYNYGAKPNAVIGVEDPNHLISQDLQNITYTSFDKIATLEEANYKLNLSYGPNDERKRSQLRDAVSNALLCERIYLDGYEKTTEGTNAYEITYISAPTGLAAMYVKQNGASQGTMHYVYTDNLGSITTLVDDNGNKLNQSFDAWGNARNPADWTTSNLPNIPNWLYRGYTGHEHLKEFALINMNGRMYDPVLARFLSPDKLLQNPSNTQNYNGYSYVLNNPLKYTDPSGWAYIGHRYYERIIDSQITPDSGDEMDAVVKGQYTIDGMPISKELALALLRIKDDKGDNVFMQEKHFNEFVFVYDNDPLTDQIFDSEEKAEAAIEAKHARNKELRAKLDKFNKQVQTESKKLKDAVNFKSNLTKLNIGVLLILQFCDIVNAERPNKLPKLYPIPHEMNVQVIIDDTLNIIDRDGRTFNINTNFNPFYDYNSDSK